MAKTVKARLALKKRLQEGTAAEEPASAKRQRLFHTRGVNTDNQHVEPWRPKRVHRIAAKKFCGHLDNQVRMSDWTIPGLSIFESAAAWRQQPHACLGHDLGSDQNTGVHALL